MKTTILGNWSSDSPRQWSLREDELNAVSAPANLLRVLGPCAGRGSSEELTMGNAYRLCNCICKFSSWTFVLEVFPWRFMFWLCPQSSSGENNTPPSL